MTGQTFGHYRVQEQIGAGGMGGVYRAHDEHLERDVALKMLPPGFLADETARRRFRHEALALSKLNHPNIATVFDFDTEGGVDFLAMELIHGLRLSDRMQGGPLSDAEIVRLGSQLAEGLATAHAEGVIHRDLKPGNLMITPEGRLKILDFGLAVLVQPDCEADTTHSLEAATVAGTLPYMSPEQLRGLPPDTRSDVYAAGAVLYEMATGRRPFPQSQHAELIGAILHEPPMLPRTRNRGLSAGLERVVMKALDKEPLHRYQSARELLIAIEGAGGVWSGARLRWREATAIAAAAIVALAAALDVGGIRDRLWRGAPPARETSTSNGRLRARRAVAVLGFQNLSGRPDAAWLSMALSEMLTTELAAGEQLRTIPGENISQMKINLALADADSYGKTTLAKIRDNLGTDHVVVGSYVPLGGGQLRLDLRLQDAVAGETLAAI
jgi:TolB-like protein